MRVLLASVVAFGVVALDEEDASCTQFAGKTYKLFVEDVEDAGQWLSHADDGNWLYARYDRETDAAPFYFEAVLNRCNQYTLRNDWKNLGQPWLSYADDGLWLRTIYGKDDAMPIEFKDVGSGQYKMQNQWPGQDGWISWTSDGHRIRTIYSEEEAMKVTLHDAISDYGVADAQICMTELLSFEGGSSGWREDEVTIVSGMTSSKSYSEDTVKSASAKVSASADYGAFSAGAEVATDVQSTVNSAAEQTSSVQNTRKETVHVDMSMPCHIYQAQLKITFNDGGETVQTSPTFIQKTQPLDTLCISVGVEFVV